MNDILVADAQVSVDRVDATVADTLATNCFDHDANVADYTDAKLGCEEDSNQVSSASTSPETVTIRKTRGKFIFQFDYFTYPC
jgi:hypothetical protein